MSDRRDRSRRDFLTGWFGTFKEASGAAAGKRTTDPAKALRPPGALQPDEAFLAACTGCGDCAAACPAVHPNEFDMGLKARKAIYRPFPQAVPIAYAIGLSSLFFFALNHPDLVQILPQRMFAGFNSYTLMALPLTLAMTAAMSEGTMGLVRWPFIPASRQACEVSAS